MEPIAAFEFKDSHSTKMPDKEGDPNVIAVIDQEGILYVWKECLLAGKMQFRLMGKSFIDSQDHYQYPAFHFSLKWFSFFNEQ